MREIRIVEEEVGWFEQGELREDWVLALHRRFGKQIEVEFPSPLNGERYGLRSAGYVGQLDIEGELRLRIAPKTSVESVFGMLEYAYDLPSFRLLEGSGDLGSIAQLFEVLALQLSVRVLDRARRGLHREYIEFSDELLVAKGRLQFAPSVRALARGSSRLSCVFEEQTPDIEDNQILAWTLGQLRRYRFENPQVGRKVREAYRSLAVDISSRSFRSGNCAGRFYDRMNRDYQILHRLCRFFLEHLGPEEEESGEPFVPFVLYMPNLFESFVARWLEQHSPDRIRVRPHRIVDLEPRKKYQFDIDLVLEDRLSGEALAVVDTKYKAADRLSSSDVAQIVAYATAMKTKLGVLVYPTSAHVGIRLAAGGVRVEPLSFDLSLPFSEGGERLLTALLARLSKRTACTAIPRQVERRES